MLSTLRDLMHSFLSLQRNRSARLILCLLPLAAVVAVHRASFAADQTGVSVPEGFSVSLFADDDLANDVYSMTLDSQGRVVVSGRGYVRILIDSDGDGKADTARQFADGPETGAQGLYFHGRDLLCVGDEGLIRYRDRDGDDRADGPPDVFLRIKTGGEHHAHAVRRGPDGWWYLLAGNMAGVTSRYATLPTSPIHQPQAGVLMRLKPDLTGGEILADGFRNAYDFAFNPHGDLFVYDSDGERDVSLPWYRPTRVFHALPGSNAGWVSRSWKRPGYFFDMPPAVAQLGRGSPTGVACYRHRRFPARYRGALFVCDWTFGRVVALPHSATGGRRPADGSKHQRASARRAPETFMTGVGQFGFAPTDIAVGPRGALYVSVGGRGTRGGVFRIRYQTSEPAAADENAPRSRTSSGSSHPRRSTLDPQLQKCLQAPQPLSSWSRAVWMPLARQLGRDAFAESALNEKLTGAARVRAIEILTELFGGLSDREAAALVESKLPLVRARVGWSLGRTETVDSRPEVMVSLLNDRDPLVVRFALEALIGIGDKTKVAAFLPALAAQLGSKDRYVRETAARVVSRLDADALEAIDPLIDQRGRQARLSFALGRVRRRSRVDIEALRLGLSLLERNGSEPMRLQATRLMQLAMGEVGPRDGRPPVFDGYASRLDLRPYDDALDPLGARIGNVYPTGSELLNHEVLRTAAMLAPRDPKLLDRVLAGIDADSHPVADIHRLIVAARLPVERNARQRNRIARALVQLEPKIVRLKLNQDSNWDERIGEMYRELARLDPDLPGAVIRQDGFGRPGHVIYLSQLPRDQLQPAVEAFVAEIAGDDDYPWTNEVVIVLGESNDPAHRELIRKQFNSFAVRDAVLLVLARDPAPQDRDKFVQGLSSSQLSVLAACLDALDELGPDHQPAEQFALLRTLRRLNSDEREYAAREKAARLLQRNMQRDLGFQFGKEGHRPQTEVVEKWTEALRSAFPNEARTELKTAEAELEALDRLLERVDWKTGDAERGAELFRNRACLGCHGGRRALGPDLAGIARRFAPADLFTAVALPNRDVSPRYQTTLVQTTGGKVYTGLVIYESVDGLILRNAQNQTFRIEADEIAVRRTLPSSLMPTGLLKDLKPRDVADLYAYLQSL